MPYKSVNRPSWLPICSQYLLPVLPVVPLLSLTAVRVTVLIFSLRPEKSRCAAVLN
jgi:hypothetical protein